MENAPIIYFVVPCYNEEEVLPLTAGILGKKLVTLINAGVIGEESRILLVDDGSRDGTWKLIENLNREDGYFLGLKLSRNRGHQNALLAGLSEAARHCDAAISLDADLQDDVDACDQMIERFKAGCDIVYGVRKKRTTDSAFKRLTAEGFYKLMNLLGANTVYNHADFRLMSRRALKGLKEFTEVNLFLRGIVPMIGYPSDVVYYDRKERAAGESKYPLGKMLAFAIEGITSLSIKPIRLITFAGIASFFVSWASIMVSIWFIGGLLLLSIGIVGEYIGKIYLETKRRPRYLVETRLDDREADTRNDEESAEDEDREESGTGNG